MTNSLDGVTKRAMRNRRRRRATILLDSDDVYGWSVRQAQGKAPVAKWELHPDPLVSLVSVPGVLAGIERLTMTLVYQAREDDLSWADIGQCLGISRQAAQKRYGIIDQVLAGNISLDDLEDDLDGPDL